MLGMRKNTASDICHAEAGCPLLPDLMRYKQHKFISDMWNECNSMTDDSLQFAMVTTIQSNSPAGELVNELITTPVPDWDTLMISMHDKINRTQSSWCNTYKDLNPLLAVHEVQ